MLLSRSLFTLLLITSTQLFASSSTSSTKKQADKSSHSILDPMPSAEELNKAYALLGVSADTNSEAIAFAATNLYLACLNKDFLIGLPADEAKRHAAYRAQIMDAEKIIFFARRLMLVPQWPRPHGFGRRHSQSAQQDDSKQLPQLARANSERKHSKNRMND